MKWLDLRSWSWSCRYLSGTSKKWETWDGSGSTTLLNAVGVRHLSPAGVTAIQILFWSSSFTENYKKLKRFKMYCPPLVLCSKFLYFLLSYYSIFFCKLFHESMTTYLGMRMTGGLQEVGGRVPPDNLNSSHIHLGNCWPEACRTVVYRIHWGFRMPAKHRTYIIVTRVSEPACVGAAPAPGI